MRRDVASVVVLIFEEWVPVFLEKVIRRLKSFGKVIFLDEYRAHMSFRALTLLEKAGVVVFTLPAHTSDTLQQLDVSVFGLIKGSSSALIDGIGATALKICIHNYNIDNTDVLKVIKWSCLEEENPQHIISGFLKSGLWALDGRMYCKRGLRCSIADKDLVPGVEIEKRARKIFISMKGFGAEKPSDKR